MTRRFVVRTLHGYAKNTANGNGQPGVTVWVADESMFGREIRVWRTEEMRGMRRVDKVPAALLEARRLARVLNAEERKAAA